MSLAPAVALWVLVAAPTEGLGEYPFGPVAFGHDDAPLVTKVGADLQRRGGLQGALRLVCAHGRRADAELQGAIENLVARNFLIEHADQSLPLLLDTARRGERANTDAAVACAGEARWLVGAAICFGYDIGGTGPTMDAHPLATRRRAQAQQAFATILAAGGSRSHTALDILMDSGGICTGLEDTMRRVTPQLVKRLGVPRPGMRIPRDARSADQGWERALRALALRGADRSIAEAPVAAFLDAAPTAPLAALALARMGVDASAAVPRLARIAEAIDVKQSDQLTQLGDIADSLTLVGQAASPALPSLAALLRRDGAPGCHSLGTRRWVALVRTIATPTDAAPAAAVLAPLAQCNRLVFYTTTEAPLLPALASLGSPGRGALASVMRDERRTIAERMEAAQLIGKFGEGALDDGGHRLLARLRRKSDAHPAGLAATPSPASPPPPAFENEIAACRTEAGVTPAAVPPIKEDPTRSRGLVSPSRRDQAAQGFALCLSQYLCGPAIETYTQTMGRCCRLLDNTGSDVPFCDGLRDPAEARGDRR